MKTQKMKEIRMIGILMIMISLMIGIYSLRNDVINGEEVGSILIMIVGLYLAFGTKESF